MKKMIKFSLILLLAFMAVSVFASETLDQSCPWAEGQDIRGFLFGWQASGGADMSPLCGQTIVTGQDVTNISKVRVAIWDATAFGDAAYDGHGSGVRLSIWNDTTRTELLGQAFAPDTEVTGWDSPLTKLTDFVFTPPVTVEPDTSYFLELGADQRGGQYYVIVTWYTPYTDGQWYYSNAPYYVHGWDVISKFYSDAAGLSQTLQIQDMPVPDGGAQLLPLSQAVIGQTFTATTSVLERIDVAMMNADSASGGVTMHLYKGGVGRSDYIASAYADDSAIGTSWGYVPFVFEEQLELIPNHMYFMEFVSSDNTNAYQLGVSPGVADYVNGEFYRNDVPWYLGWNETDWIFETYTASEPEYCGDVWTVYSPMDLNTDCVVNMKDFAFFALSWLDCTDPLGCN